MSLAYLNAKLRERATLSDAANGVLDKCAKDGVNPSVEQRTQLDGWRTEIETLDSEIVQLRTALEANDRFETIISASSRLEESHERRAMAMRDGGRPAETPKTIGEQFVESDAFKNYEGAGTSRRVEFAGFLETRAAISTADLNIPPIPVVPSIPTYSAPLLNVIGHEVVGGGSVSYITWSDPSDAAVVAEGAAKPEATFMPIETTVGLETYAHWKAITRQALEDYPRIQSIVEGELRRGLTNALSTAAATAIGGATFEEVNDSDLLKGIRQAAGVVQANGYNPNAVLLNPADWANLDVDTAMDSNNGPTAYGSYWGLTPIPNPAQVLGTAEVGDFKSAVTWFDRAKTAVYLTDSHSDYFVRNLLVILAETRAAFAVTDLRAAASVTTAVVPLAAKASK
jgi:HK97 family phage major capsid protein